MDISVAKRIVETLESVHGSLLGLLPYLQESCSEQEFSHLKREIARVVNGADANLLPIVLAQFPDLDPLRGRAE